MEASVLIACLAVMCVCISLLAAGGYYWYLKKKKGSSSDGGSSGSSSSSGGGGGSSSSSGGSTGGGSSGSKSSGKCPASSAFKPCKITAFDVVNSDADDHYKFKLLLQEYKVTKEFVAHTNVAAVITTGKFKDHWDKYKYRAVYIKYKGKCARFEVWDVCAGGDCGGNSSGEMLFDLDTSACKRAWGLKDAAHTLEDKATYAWGEKIDPTKAAKKYKFKKS